jgi:hypothetical protein
MRDLDRPGMLMQMDSRIVALGKRYLTPVSYLPAPDANKAMGFLKETVATARRCFLEDGCDLWISECEELAGLLEKSPWYGKARTLLAGQVPQVNIPGGTGDLLRTLYWESKVVSEEGSSLEETALITAGKALNARDPKVFLTRDAEERHKRVTAALGGGCSPVEVKDIEEAFALAVLRGTQVFDDPRHFQGCFNWNAQLVANGLVSSEAEILSKLSQIKVVLHKEFLEPHRAGFQYLAQRYDKKPEEIFDHCFEVWEAFVSGKLYA